MDLKENVEVKLPAENLFNQLHLTHQHTNELEKIKSSLYNKYAANKLNKESVIINNVINELSKLIATFQYLSEEEQVILVFHSTSDILKLLKYSEASIAELLKLEHVRPILTIHIQAYEKKLATCCGFMRS